MKCDFCNDFYSESEPEPESEERESEPEFSGVAWRGAGDPLPLLLLERPDLLDRPDLADLADLEEQSRLGQVTVIRVGF